MATERINQELNRIIQEGIRRSQEKSIRKDHLYVKEESRTPPRRKMTEEDIQAMRARARENDIEMALWKQRKLAEHSKTKKLSVIATENTLF